LRSTGIIKPGTLLWTCLIWSVYTNTSSRLSKWWTVGIYTSTVINPTTFRFRCTGIRFLNHRTTNRSNTAITIGHTWWMIGLAKGIGIIWIQSFSTNSWGACSWGWNTSCGCSSTGAINGSKFTTLYKSPNELLTNSRIGNTPLSLSYALRDIGWSCSRNKGFTFRVWCSPLIIATSLLNTWSCFSSSSNVPTNFSSITPLEGWANGLSSLI